MLSFGKGNENIGRRLAIPVSLCRGEHCVEDERSSHILRAASHEAVVPPDGHTACVDLLDGGWPEPSRIVFRRRWSMEFDLVAGLKVEGLRGPARVRLGCSLYPLFGGHLHHASESDLADSVVMPAGPHNSSSIIGQLEVGRWLELGHQRRKPAVECLIGAESRN